jgi:hypothetical protein
MSPIKKYFPEYRGKSTDIQAAETFFAGKFRHVFPPRGREFRISHINATDTDSVRGVFGSIHEMIIEHRLYQDSGPALAAADMV